MSTTIVPAYDGPIEPFDVEELRLTLKSRLESSQGDEDKATDSDAMSYWEGMVDAYTEILEWLTNPELRT